MTDLPSISDAFLVQAAYCRANDAPITAAVSEAALEALDRSTPAGRRVLDWRGNPVADALVLRLVGGLHALARSGDSPTLAAVFRGERTKEGTVADIAAALRAHDARLGRWLDTPPQTNDVGRSAALAAGLLWLAERHPLPVDLWEIGSSSGLNLLMARFRLELGGVALGPADSPVRIAPDWRGCPPPDAPLTIASARGVDRDPLDVTDRAEADRLASYIWADHPIRVARTDAAIALARAHPPRLERGEAADWVEARLAEPPVPGRMRALTHSIVWQYLDEDSQARITAAMERAGAEATADTPLGWVALEADRTLMRHDLVVRVWPGDGEPVRLAHSHAHGFWVEWLGS